jgi:hypothetical protein
MPGEAQQTPTGAAAPLTRAELEQLWRREHWMSWLQIAAMAGFLLAAVVSQRGAAAAALASPLLVGAVALLGVGAVLQVLTRCPRCLTPLRGKILRMLPDKCPRCGIDFPRKP